MRNKIVPIVLLAIVTSIAAGCVSNTPASTSSPLPGSPDWCKPGTKYTTTNSAYGTSTVEIKGIVDYKGRSVCELDMTTDQYKIITYASQDGSYSHQVMEDKNGTFINEMDTSKTP